MSTAKTGGKTLKLSDDDVRWIRNVGFKHSTPAKMAVMFKVSIPYIRDVLKYKSRKSVSERN